MISWMKRKVKAILKKLSFKKRTHVCINNSPHKSNNKSIFIPLKKRIAYSKPEKKPGRKN